MPVKEALEILGMDLKTAEDALNSFLNKHQVILKQHQFDALVSFTHQYGTDKWSNEKRVMTIFIREGKDFDKSAKVMDIFRQHIDDLPKREKEAKVFLYGY